MIHQCRKQNISPPLSDPTLANLKTTMEKSKNEMNNAWMGVEEVQIER